MLRDNAYPLSKTNNEQRIVCYSAGLRPYSFIFLAWLLAGVCVAQSVPARDTQLWTEYSLTKHFENRFAITGQTSLRFWDGISRLAEEHAGAGVSYAANSHFAFSTWYRFLRQVNELDRLQHEHRVWLEGTARLPIGAGFGLSDRNRLEWRVLNGTLSERYRNYIRLDHAIHQVTPYLAWEIFYDTRFHAWTKQREYIGARFPLRRHLWLDTSFLHTDDHFSRPFGNNTIATAFRFDY